jgi:ATP adenylyltransferase
MINDSDCIFCSIDDERILNENQHAVAIRDQFPVTHLHTLVIPKRHAPDYFDLTQEEILACDSLLRFEKDSILAQDKTVEGFNVGINAGEVAGQTIPHCHIHLIPRRNGDVPKPRGGVRNTIPGKGDY